MANEIHGPKSYLMLVSETTWGSNPEGISGSGSGSGSSGFIHVPVDTYDVRFRPEARQPNPFLGIHQQKRSKIFRGMPSGTLATKLYGAAAYSGTSLAQYLMDWAFGSPEDPEPPSKTAYWAEGPDIANSEHNGLRVNQATLSGSADSGVIELSLDLMGKTEDALDEMLSPPADRDKIVDFEYQDASFQLASSAIKLRSFQVQLTRNLEAHYLDEFTPSHLFAGNYVMTVQMEPVKNSTTYDVIRRSSSQDERTGRITLKGLHNGTLADNFAQVQIDFDRLAFVDADDDRNRDNLNFQTLNFQVLKPDSSNNGFRTTWSTQT